MPGSGDWHDGANLAAPGSGALCEQTGVHKSFVKIDVFSLFLGHIARLSLPF
jgi:hypothetical protein